MNIKTLKKIGKVEYKGKDNKETFTFKHYDAEEVIMGKKMKDHLKFAMSYWHTLVAEGVDIFGEPTSNKSFGEVKPMDIFKAKARFGFESFYLFVLCS